MQSTRALPFRSKPTAAYEASRAELQRTTLFLVARNGPSVFSIKDASISPHGENGSSSSGVSYKVVIGNPHSCTCGYNSNNELCIHQLFCLLKVLRVPDTHPLSYQLALTDTETDQVLNGILASSGTRNRQRGSSSRRNTNVIVAPGDLVARQEVDDNEEHICPICQDDVSPSQALTWCRKGCGNNIHANCMQTFAQYKISNREPVVCPLCREQWALECLRDDCRGKASLRNSCISINCINCKQKLKSGIFFRCVECSNSSGGGFHKYEDFCENCYPSINMTHAQHHFVSSEAFCDSFKEVNWQSCVNPRSAVAPLVTDDILRELQARELRDEDYDLLLRLTSNTLEFPSLLVQSLPIFRPISHNNSTQKKTCWCKCDHNSSSVNGSYSSGINVNGTFRLLPCKHIVHDKCMETNISRCINENNMSNHAVYKLTCCHQSCKVKLFTALTRKKKTAEKSKQQLDNGVKDENSVNASIASAASSSTIGSSSSSIGISGASNALLLDISGRGLTWNRNRGVPVNTAAPIPRSGSTNIASVHATNRANLVINPSDAPIHDVSLVESNRVSTAQRRKNNFLRSLTPTLTSTESLSGVRLIDNSLTGTNININSSSATKHSGARGVVRSARAAMNKGSLEPVDFSSAVSLISYPSSSMGNQGLNGSTSNALDGAVSGSVMGELSSIQKIQSLRRLLRKSSALGGRSLQGRLVNLTPVADMGSGASELVLGNTI